MRRLLLGLLVAILAISASAGPARGWSFKEHILLTRLAVQRLLADPTVPPQMKAWLREASPNAGDLESARIFLLETHIGPEPQGLERLDYWTIFPDLARKVDGDKPVAPFGVPEAPMHFIDLELLMPGDDVKQFKQDLSNKPKLEDLPRDWRDPRLVQAGYLPWRIEQIYAQLVTAIGENRLMPGGEHDRDNALVLAGHLAHYLADNTQPQHATIDFRSRAYFAIPQRAPDVHGMLEYGMVDWEGRPYPELRQELWDQLLSELACADRQRALDGVLGDRGRIDPWSSTVRVSMASYDALGLIGEAAQAAVGQKVKDGDPSQPIDAPAREADQFDMEAFFRQRGTVSGSEMSLLEVKARQLSLAVLRIEAMLKQAWAEADEK